MKQESDLLFEPFCQGDIVAIENDDTFSLCHSDNPVPGKYKSLVFVVSLKTDAMINKRRSDRC